MLNIQMISAQSLSFELKSTPDIEFIFNSIDKYNNGIIIPNALELNVSATGCQWDLYAGVTTVTPGNWNTTVYYSNTGNIPAVSLLHARIYNSANTGLMGGGFFQLADIATPVYIIGSASDDAAVNCSDANPTGTNTAGSYASDPSCYRFRVDLKALPGLDCRAGLYTLRIDFILMEDL
jgi:hypothetical protein